MAGPAWLNGFVSRNPSAGNCIFNKMKRAIAPLILLLLLAAGCEMEKDPVEEPLDPSLLLTDGFCLLSNSRVVLNHYDIDYYDYSAHLIYLKSSLDFEKEFTVPGTASAYADSTRIYDLSLHSAVASYIVYGPLIMVPQVLYPDYTVHIDHFWNATQVEKEGNNPCDDPRIVEALLKYGQFRHGLQCEIASLRYKAPVEVELQLELWNEDTVNYYYWDPAKLGMERYHYVTNGLWLQDENGQSYRNHVDHLSWDGADQRRMSLLESDSSVILTITYEDFDELPPGTYDAYFQFPAPHYNVAREDLELEEGRVWLGELQLYKEIVLE